MKVFQKLQKSENRKITCRAVAIFNRNFRIKLLGLLGFYQMIEKVFSGFIEKVFRNQKPLKISNFIFEKNYQSIEAD